MITTLCYFALAVSLYSWLDWRAFVVALVISQLLTVPAYWRLFRNEYHIELGSWLVFSAKLVIIMAVGFMLDGIIRHISPVAGLVVFMIEAAFVTTIMGVGVYFFALPHNVRRVTEEFFQRSLSRMWP
jgi:hypothetical protein